MRKTIIVIAIFSFTSLFARFNKDIYDITYDSIYFGQKIYYSLDKELTYVYKRLARIMRRDKNILVKSEQAWIKRRDHACAFPETNSVNIQCAIRYTRKRLYFLKERLRECQEVGCKIENFF